MKPPRGEAETEGGAATEHILLSYLFRDVLDNSMKESTATSAGQLLTSLNRVFEVTELAAGIDPITDEELKGEESDGDDDEEGGTVNGVV